MDNVQPPARFRPPPSLWICIFSVAIDIFSISTVLPVVPFLALEFGASSFQLGIIYAGFGAAQAVSMPIIGSMSDRFGRKKLLVTSLVGSGCGLMIQGLAPGLSVFIVGRIVAGSFGSSMPLAESYIGDVVPENEQPRWHGILGAIVGMCFMFGPGIGAGLAQFHLQTPMKVCSVLAFAGALYASYAFKEVVVRRNAKSLTDATEMTEMAPAPTQVAVPKDEGRDEALEAKAGAEVQDEKPHPMVDADGKDAILRSRATRLMYLVSFLYMFDSASYLYFFSLLLFYKFGWGSLEFGFQAMAGSVLAIILQMKVYPQAVKRVGKHAVAICGMVSMGLGSILFVGLDPPLNSMSGMPLLVFAIMFKAVGFATAGPTIAAIATRYADKESQGAVHGISLAMQAAARFSGSLIWGYSFGVDKTLPFLCAGLTAIFGAGVAFLVLRINYLLPEHIREKGKRQKTEQDEPLVHNEAPANLESMSLEERVALLTAENEKLRQEMRLLRAAMASPVGLMDVSGTELEAGDEDGYMDALILTQGTHHVADVGMGSASVDFVRKRVRTISSSSPSPPPALSSPRTRSASSEGGKSAAVLMPEDQSTPTETATDTNAV